MRTNAGRYLGQCLAATLSVCLILLALNVVFRAGIVATLGATTFIVFAMPHSRPAQPRRVIGGYIVGAASGVICSILAQQLERLFPQSAQTINIALGSLAIGLAIFLMVATQTEHPPAAGMSLLLVLNPWDWGMILLLLSAVALLSLVRWLFRTRLIDLV